MFFQSDRNTPTKLHFDYEVLGIYCGRHHAISNTPDGIFVWGCNYSGQLGLGDNTHRNVPTELEFYHEILSIYSGYDSVIFNTIDGIFVCGDNFLRPVGSW